MKAPRLIAFALAALLSTAVGAQADLALSPSKKYVPFRVKVDNLDAHPEFVLVVYPHSNSNGVPRARARRLPTREPLSFGRRIAGRPKLYAFKRSHYEQQTKAPPVDADDPLASGPLAAGAPRKLRFPNDKAIDCNVTISPRHIAKSDGPKEFLQIYTITRLTDRACSLKLVSDSAGTAQATPSSSATVPSSSPTSAEQSPASTGKGCSGCATRHPAPTAWKLGLLLLALAVGRTSSFAKRAS